MNILISGGSGFVGSALAKKFAQLGHKIITLGSRKKTDASQDSSIEHVIADTSTTGNWQNLVREQDVIINLAGRSVFHLWSESYKKSLYNSRILTTRNLVDALPASSSAVFLSASAAGFYGNSCEQERVEQDPGGNDFLAKVCMDWESEAFKASIKGARVAVTRFGVILGKGGGAMATMKTPFQLCLGGPIGNGRQWFPWIHLEDTVNAIVYIIQGEQINGIFNFAAPQQVRQKKFAVTLGKVLKRPALLPAPAFIMKMVLGEFGSSLLQGQKVVPKALLDAGYHYSYPELQGALEEILSK